MGAVLDVITGWTLFAGLLATLGGCAARWLIVPRVSERPAEQVVHLRSTAARLALFGALLLVPAMGLYFVRQLLEFRDPFVPWTEDAELLLLGTAWGGTWVRGAAGSLVAVVALSLAARGRASGWWVGSAAALALGAFPAFTGHAGGSDGPRTLTLAADTLHVWAAAGWAGGLAFVLYAERRWPYRADASLLPALVPVFSPMAVACVGALVVSGLLGAWVHLPSWAALTGSAYGRTLLLKLTVVAAGLGLGLFNWRVLTPRLQHPGGPGALRRSATVELLVVQLALVATALLVRTPPPMG